MKLMIVKRQFSNSRELHMLQRYGSLFAKRLIFLTKVLHIILFVLLLKNIFKVIQIAKKKIEDF